MVIAGRPRTASVVSVLIGLLIPWFCARAQFAGGTGEPNDPYRIATADQLVSIGSDPNLLDKHYLLVNDIDLDPNLPGGRIFERAVIAPDTADTAGPFEGVVFSGTLDGGGHAIGHLAISGADYLGLFGHLGEESIVKNLGIVDAKVMGAGSNIGILAGSGDGRVMQCFTSGVVTGKGGVGGLMGGGWGAVVSNSYSTGTINGNGSVGGLLGDIYIGCVLNSYSTGRVNGVEDTGGLVGYAWDSLITGSFWDMEKSTQPESAGGTGLTTAQMQDIATYRDGGWDFRGDSGDGLHEIWQLPAEGGCPLLSVFQGYVPAVLMGEGTQDSPYLIETAWDLSAVASYREDACYRLTSDVDLSGIRWSMPVIGTFAGHFDGKGHVIRHLTISGAGYQGLFGRLEAGAVVENLGVVDANVADTDYNEGMGMLAGVNDGSVVRCFSIGAVRGRGNVGGLVGENMGEVTRSYSIATVDGRGPTGGLIGYVACGSVTDCYSHSHVSGNGGLIGENAFGHIIRCYSTGVVESHGLTGGLVGSNGGEILSCYSSARVEGTGLVGGLVGINRWCNEMDCWDGTIRECYASGVVMGGDRAGGLVGEYTQGPIVRSFWDIQASGRTLNYGGIGKTTAEMQTAATFRGWGLCVDESVWTIDEGRDYPRLAWQHVPGQVMGGVALSDRLAGAGTPQDPYLIYTAEELHLVSAYECEWDKHFKLMADIDLSAYPGRSFNIIAGPTDARAFEGVFDGNGHTISRFTHVRHQRVWSNEGAIGLFGAIAGPDAVVKNLGLITPDVNAVGCPAVGALAGVLDQGTIRNCFVRGGRVLGRYGVGGLVGQNWGTVRDCYNTCMVGGYEDVGGLAGHSGGQVINCYSTGAVSGAHDVGGLVGKDYSWNDVKASFWDMETSGQAHSGGGTGRQTAEMQTAATFLQAGWDFIGETANGTEDIWWIDEGKGYPQFWWQSNRESGPNP